MVLETSSNPPDRHDMLKEAWKRIGKVFILAMVLDAVYQLIELHFVYPGEMIIVAFLLAIVPYPLLRGPTMRLAQSIMRRQHEQPNAPVLKH